MKWIPLFFLFLFCAFPGIAQKERTHNFPRKNEKVVQLPDSARFWLFFLAGQSNMAGRGYVEPQDTLPDARILMLTPEKEWVVAKEPLQTYQPALTGLGPGLAFAKKIAETAAEDITIGLIPCAVGGSSVEQWLNDSLFHQVRLRSNFSSLLETARPAGTFKAIIWHQGEADATSAGLPLYKERLSSLFLFFRKETGHEKLPVIMGELGLFPGNKKYNSGYRQLNRKLAEIVAGDPAVALVSSHGTRPMPDNVHFDGKSQRLMGKRYARAYFRIVKGSKNK